MTEVVSLLIVEDHSVTLAGLESELAKYPQLKIVGTATTSTDGLRLAQNLRPDVILLDLHLPGTSGPRTMVKGFCSIPGTKVIIFSGESRQAFVQTVLALGVHGYLLKTETPDTIFWAIKEVMSGKKPVVSKALNDQATKLTRSEEEVVRLLAKGLKYQDIADARQTSSNTVRKQCELLLLKLNLQTREELIAWSNQNGFGSLDA